MVPLAGRPALRSAVRAGREMQQSVHGHRQKVATRALRRRSRISPLSIWFCLLWGMALLGLLLLPSNYRAGAESAHAHSLIQLWVDAGEGRVHHAHSGLSEPGPALSTSWFDPAVADGGRAEPVGFDDPRPDLAEQHDSAPV